MSRNMRDPLVVFITLLIVFEMTIYVATMPRSHEQFLQLYALGANRLAENYYPNGDPDIHLGDPVRWHLGVTNSMGKVQLVTIRVKLGNQTIKPPDDLQEQPSPAPLITEFKRFIQNNETWEMPFTWRILNATVVEGSTQILELGINDETYQLLGSSARNGYNFKFIFELWTWQVESSSLQFGWSAGDERQVAWLQIWFNTTSPGWRAHAFESRNWQYHANKELTIKETNEHDYANPPSIPFLVKQRVLNILERLTVTHVRKSYSLNMH